MNDLAMLVPADELEGFFRDLDLLFVASRSVQHSHRPSEHGGPCLPAAFTDRLTISQTSSKEIADEVLPEYVAAAAPLPPI